MKKEIYKYLIRKGMKDPIPLELNKNKDRVDNEI